MRKDIAKTLRVEFSQVNQLVYEGTRVGEIAVLKDRRLADLDR